MDFPAELCRLEATIIRPFLRHSRGCSRRSSVSCEFGVARKSWCDTSCTRAGRLVFAGPVLAIAAGWRRARMESSPKRSERSASDAAASSTSLAQDGIESGEGELSDSPAGPAEEVGASRRGAASLRERNLHAFEEAHFPPYPADPPAEAPFALPACYLDPDAPVSAHKWCARARRSCARLCCCQAHAPALLRSALALRDSPAPGVPPSLPSSQAALAGPRRTGG